jgi:hypothetical protein
VNVPNQSKAVSALTAEPAFVSSLDVTIILGEPRHSTP